MKIVSVWMWVLFIAIGLILFIFILILITKITITLSLYHGNDNDHFKVKMRAWYGLIKYTIDIPLVKLDDDGPNIVVEEESKKGDESNPSKKKTSKITPSEFINSLHDTKEMIVHVQSFHHIIRKFTKKVKLDKVQWKTLFGTGDAASTGTLTGIIWGMKGSIVGILSGYMKLQSMPHLEVIPTFQKAIIQTQFSCIIQFRIGNAILVGLKILRYWRGGKGEFKTKPLSTFSEEKQSV
ncbi:DUF2953 domain-containing protein [Rossellomorea aquimaris]|uniref:DUF2953 domain-containing protein n=1 Tax=Rossellomorea aquimaris TaxID=189382 RepID=UPI000A9AA355|nr:DUF2953 domain-containing protein [Rossellomorea aquimaris]